MGSVVFDGVDDKAVADSIPTGLGTSGGNHQFTFAVWVKVSVDQGGAYAALTDSTGDDVHSMGYRADQNRHWVTSRTGTHAAANGPVASLDTWYAVVGAWADPETTLFGTASRSRAIAVDGGTNDGDSTSVRQAVFDTFVVGTWESTFSQPFLDGKIAYVFVWDRALTSAEVDDWVAGTIPAEANLVDWWDLSVDPSGGPIASQTGSGNSLTLTGTTFDSVDAPGVTYSTGGTAHALAGTIAGTSTASGALALGFPLSGALAGASTASGALSLGFALSGASSGSSTVSGDLSVSTAVQLLSGTVIGVSALTGDLQRGVALAASAAGASTVAGDLTVITPALALSGLISGVSAVSGDLSVTRGLSGTVSAASEVAGSISLGQALRGTITGISTLKGTLTGGIAVLTADEITDLIMNRKFQRSRRIDMRQTGVGRRR